MLEALLSMLAAVAAMLMLQTPSPDAPPRALGCLARHYVGKPVLADGGWALELPDGKVLPWDDGKEKSDEALDTEADLQDALATPYPRGPIAPVEGDGSISDPGRARVVELFTATYGSTEAEVAAQLQKVRFFGLRYPFHARAAPALARVVDRLTALVAINPKLLPYLKDIGGTWHWRTIARSKALSAHAFGIAIDLNVDRSTYWRWQRPKKPLKWKNKLPTDIVEAFEAEGFIWGGRWVHYDTMHFEYRPELLDADCRP